MEVSNQREKYNNTRFLQIHPHAGLRDLDLDVLDRGKTEPEREERRLSMIDRIPDLLMAAICTGILLLTAVGEMKLVCWMMS